MTVTDDVLAEIQLLVACGFDSPDAIAEQLADQADSADPALEVAIAATFSRSAEASRAWPEVTDCDRLRAAFEALERDGIVAEQHHHEDVIDGVEGRGLWLAYGALGATDEAATLALGRELVATLDAHGVAWQWSQAADERIRVLPFEWRRRRWTTAPPHARTTAARPSRSWWSRWFGSPRRGATPARAFLVRAEADERGFDLRRSREIRAAWTAAGDAQVAHLGVPHAFLPTGEPAALTARPAAHNLGDERVALFLRGQRAAGAR